MSKLSVRAPKKQPSKTQRPPPVLLKKQKELNDNFATNALLVSGLLPLLPRDERNSIEKWMKKLYTLGATDEDRSTRNDYIWFLLVQMESGIITLPFIAEPPAGKLKPVAKSVDKETYEHILAAANKTAETENELEMPKEEKHPECEPQVTIKPEEFYGVMPRPRLGFIAYGSCFSNQD